MLTSSTQLQNRSFHVVERTRTPTKCQKMNCTCKACKNTVFYCQICKFVGGVFVAIVVVAAYAPYYNRKFKQPRRLHVKPRFKINICAMVTIFWLLLFPRLSSLIKKFHVRFSERHLSACRTCSTFLLIQPITNITDCLSYHWRYGRLF